MILGTKNLDYKKMKRIINVNTGEVKTSKEDVILKSAAIGSCVVIAAYDKKKKVGSLAHIMLPGKSPEKNNLQKTRYACNAVKKMIKDMVSIGANENSIEVCIIGAGNVLKRKDDTICRSNIDSVVQLLKGKGIKINAKAVGGRERRSAFLNIEKGSIYYSENGSNEKLLWKSAVNK